MRSLLRASLIVCLALGIGLTGTARAGSDAEKQIKERTKQAMENFDMLEYEQAKKLLLEAVVIAKKNDLADSRVLADTYLYLGILHFAGFEDSASAKLAFMDAVSVDPDATLDIAYRTSEMQALLDEVKSEVDVEPSASGSDCEALEGVDHALVDTAQAGASKTLRADVSDDLEASKVVLHYRPDGADDFKEVRMERLDGCTFEGTIPAKAFKGPILHYFIAAHDKSGRVLAGSGSKGSPHLIEIEGGDDVGDENPLEIEDDVRRVEPPTTSKRRVFVAAAVGSGGGYVSGETEQVNADVACCFAPALLHLFPELGVYFGSQLSVSVAARIGFPLDANREGRSGVAPSVLLRFRYALDPSGDGFLVSGAIGGGVLRNTVRLSMVPAGEGDIDTAASGPLLIGAGAGFSKPIGGPARFVAEVNALAAIPVVEEFAQVTPAFALQLDVNLGLLLAF